MTLKWAAEANFSGMRWLLEANIGSSGHSMLAGASNFCLPQPEFERRVSLRLCLLGESQVLQRS